MASYGYLFYIKVSGTETKWDQFFCYIIQLRKNIYLVGYKKFLTVQDRC